MNEVASSELSQLLRCLNLLEEVKNCASSYVGLKYSEVQISHELMKEIKKEVLNYEKQKNKTI